MDENMKTEEGKTNESEVKINAETVEENKSDAPWESGQTVDEMENQQSESNRVKNLISAVILLAGLLVGSLFVDAAQFFSGSGYSERALKNAEIFEGAGKTWVSFNDPMVRTKVLTVADDEMESCPKCDPTEVVNWLKRFVPTVVPQKVDVASAEGQSLIEKYNIKTVPAFLFDNKMKDTEFYEGEAQVLFQENQDRFMLNSSQLGVPVGKYLEIPTIAQDDPVIGNRAASVQIVVLSDHECPYCKQFYTTMTKVAKEYGDKVALTYKEYPLDFHKRAKSAAMAALCANEQGKYWLMTDQLFNSQQEWSKASGNDIYKNYAKKLTLDSKKFDECIDQEKFSSKIEEDLAMGKDYGISGTPSAFVNDQFLGGVVKEDELKKMIDEQLSK